MCPLVCFENLLDLILHFIQLNEEACTLVQDGSVPEDEFGVKVGGDHGVHSFKFSFHLVNVIHPNSLHNTIPFLVFAATNSPSNLSTTFQPYAEQIQTLQQTKWKGKQIKVSLWRLQLHAKVSWPLRAKRCPIMVVLLSYKDRNADMDGHETQGEDSPESNRGSQQLCCLWRQTLKCKTPQQCYSTLHCAY